MIDIEIFTQPGFNKLNEDFVCHKELTIGVHAVVVADGMGGLSCGDVAAKLTAESIVSFLCDATDENSMTDRISDGIKFANDVIRRECESRKMRMGASVVVAVIDGNECYYSSLGNVRMYVLRNKKVRQVTEDHINIIAGESYLTRCVNGKPMRHPVIVSSILLCAEDKLVVATDGYYKHNDVVSENNRRIVKDDDATLVKIIANKEI